MFFGLRERPSLSYLRMGQDPEHYGLNEQLREVIQELTEAEEQFDAD